MGCSLYIELCLLHRIEPDQLRWAGRLVELKIGKIQEIIAPPLIEQVILFEDLNIERGEEWSTMHLRDS